MKSRNHRMSGRVAREGRQKQALARQAVRSYRTPQEQREVLDERLGAGVGAKRERARLEQA